MSDIHHLETNLDLKQNLNVYANCKQLDILHLVFNIFDDGVQANLSNYNVRLKAMKSDNVPLIQDTQYTVINNVVTIIANGQLTTTSGIAKIELQFINKTTGEKKATFNLNLKVIASTLEIDRSISTATYTLLEELENKLDQALDFFENIDEAVEVNTTLVATTNNASTTNNTLNTTISTGNTLKTNLSTVNNTASTNITNLTTQNNNATSNTTTLTTKNGEAITNITNLTTQNTNATSNISTLTTKNSDAVTNKSNLDSSISTANTTKTALDLSNTTANTTKTDLNTSNTTALATKSALDTSNTNATTTKIALDASDTTANTTKTNLDSSNTTANTTKTNLDTSNANATAIKSALDALITNANTTKSELTTINTTATTTENDLTTINTTASTTKTNLTTENVRAEANITAMQGFGDVTELTQNVTNLKTEIENARNGEINLDTRLDKVTTQLSEKAKDTDSTRTTTSKTVTGAINELNDGVTTLSNELEVANYGSSVTASSEINDISTDMNKQVSVDVQGKTVINLLGNDGDCEDVSKWISMGTSILALDPTKVFGSYGIKITQNTGILWSEMGKNVTNTINKSKYYCLSAYVRNGTATNGYVLTADVNGSYISRSPVITDTTKFNRTFVKLQPLDLTNVVYVSVGTNGTAGGQYAYFDGIMLEEITASQYNDVNFVPSPYVNSDMSVGESPTRVKTRGKNIFNINKLVYGGGVGLSYDISDNKVVARKTSGVLAFPYQFVYGKPNTTYTISGSINNLSKLSIRTANLWSATFTPDLDVVTTNSSMTKASGTFTTDYTGKIEVMLMSKNTADIGTFIFDDVQVEEGSVATAYEPYKETYLNLNQPLRSLPNGVKDEIKDGRLINRVEKVTLDGSVNYIFGQGYTGYKYVNIPKTSLSGIYISTDDADESEPHLLLNCRSKALVNCVSFATYGSQYECYNLNSSSNYLALTINNSDSGWGDSYTPTSDEIKAYFYGWKMYYSNDNGASVAGIYNGAGTKYWARLYLGQGTDEGHGYVGSSGGITSVPTTLATNYIPYRLYYQLAVPTITELSYPNLIAYSNGNLIMESDSLYWVRPTIAYEISDNIKANLDSVIANLNKTSRKVYEGMNTTYLSMPTTLNVNDCVDGGIYRIPAYVRNAPMAGNSTEGELHVYYFSLLYVEQFFRSIYGGIYQRVKSNGVWGNWSSIGISNGVVQTKLNADMLDGKHASDFAPSGYGLGTIATNINNADLNSLQTTGFYQGYQMTNAPTNGFYYVTVITYGTGWTVQNATGFGAGSTNNAPDDMYSRTNKAGNWGAWRRIAYSEVINLTMLNAWVAYDAGYDFPRATRIGNVVTLSGLIKNGTIGTAFAQLPVGWRPIATVIGVAMNTSNTVIGRVDIKPDGTINVVTATSNAWISTTGISFYVPN